MNTKRTVVHHCLKIYGRMCVKYLYCIHAYTWIYVGAYTHRDVLALHAMCMYVCRDIWIYTAENEKTSILAEHASVYGSQTKHAIVGHEVSPLLHSQRYYLLPNNHCNRHTAMYSRAQPKLHAG